MIVNKLLSVLPAPATSEKLNVLWLNRISGQHLAIFSNARASIGRRSANVQAFARMSQRNKILYASWSSAHENR